MGELNGAVLDQRHEHVDALVDRLNQPATAAALHTLLDNAELLALLVGSLDGIFRRGDTIIETVSEAISEVRAATYATGIQPAETAKQIATLVPALAEATPAINRVLESGIVEPEPMAVLAEAAHALVAGLQHAQTNETKVGLVGLMKALRDDDVQRGLGFVIEMAKVFGREMSTVRLPAGTTPQVA